MMKVEPGQGTEKALSLVPSKGSWSSRKLSAATTVSGGVLMAVEIELVSEFCGMGCGARRFRTMIVVAWVWLAGEGLVLFDGDERVSVIARLRWCGYLMVTGWVM